MPNYFLKSLIKKTFCHYLPGDMEGGGIMKKVTNGDGGSKIWHFRGDVIFEAPKYLNTYIQVPQKIEAWKLSME